MIELNKIYNEDSLLFLKRFPARFLNLIISDPPFGIKHGNPKKANYNRNADNVLNGYNEIPQEEYLQFSKTWIKEAFRILKDNGIIVVISGWNNLKDILISLEEAGFILFDIYIWKFNFGVSSQKRFVSSHYEIPIAIKNPNDYTFNKLDYYPEDCSNILTQSILNHFLDNLTKIIKLGNNNEALSEIKKMKEDLKEYDFILVDPKNVPMDIISINKEYWKDKLKTPNKLPKKLVKTLLLYLTNENDIVLDCFSGSGTIPKICKQLKRHYIGIEINKEIYDFSIYRMNNLEY